MSKKTEKPAEKTISDADEKPKRLSKMADWKLKHPDDLVTIIDIKAVMK
ncbi:MAG: hypothetical protein LBP72_09825 [Dysgonamonadaceae bacterium]|jgi:hypothetical protein|nr:hypothetical protein [Dysgonamonadaceae bacterium]